MGEFSADWLALREPADHRARSAALTRAALDALPRTEPAGVLDLACGTGSNMRYIEAVSCERGATLKGSPHATPKGSPHKQEESPYRLRWLLVDRDAALLARVPRAANVETRQLDLTTLDAPLFRGRQLVTGSALLDLVSHAWLDQLAAQCAGSGVAAALFALTYDGRIAFVPADRDDNGIRDAVNRHQLTDKGFGPALGPKAAGAAAACFTARGFGVERARSDWVLGADERELQRQLIDGWTEAARSVALETEIAIDAWRRRRLSHVDAGRSTLVVGHEDLIAIR